MEVTPEAVREGKFREALRGYNRDDVDEFLERVASGIAVLQERLRQATERATRAESQATEAAELDESLRRTLVLAQRTADLAVEEARREAAQLIDDARAQHDALTAEVDEERARLRAETQATVSHEVTVLHEARETLSADIAALGEYYERQREWLRAALNEQLRVLEEGGLDAGTTPPPVSAVDPEVIDAAVGLSDVDGEVQAFEPSQVAEESMPVANEPRLEPPVDEPIPNEPIPHDADTLSGASAEADVALDRGEEGRSDTSNGTLSAAAPSAGGDNGAGPDTAAVFLSELQRVMDAPDGTDPTEDDELPPPDARARAFFDEDDSEGARRFGGIRRRRRRA